MKNVLVTGAATPLGRGVLHHLRGHEGIEHLVGLEPETSSDWVAGAELVRFPSEHRELVGLLAEQPIDTVIHCDMAPDRSGSQATASEARVVETMRLGAAVASPDSSVRSWVIASSSSVYPIGSQGPLLYRETHELDGALDGPAASLREAEDYARDVAARRPHLDVAILRLQQLVGPKVRSPMGALLDQPVLPRVIGYDPPIQLLALEDAVEALVFAARLELAGVYNVASAGLVRMSEIVRALGRRSLPVLPFEAAGLLGAMARRAGVPHVPEGLLPTLRFGNGVDTHKLASAGFAPGYDQDDCLAALRR